MTYENLMKDYEMVKDSSMIEMLNDLFNRYSHDYHKRIPKVQKDQRPIYGCWDLAYNYSHSIMTERHGVRKIQTPYGWHIVDKEKLFMTKMAYEY